jgi:aspartyl-tRNA(Asn)/glutamyl-tRNA(Gln) amidotransferase subunit A
VSELEVPDLSDVGETFTLGVLAGQLSDPSVTPEVRAALQAALDRLAAAGWTVREVSAPWADEPVEWEQVLANIVAHEAYGVHRSRETGGYATGTQELLRFGKSVAPREYDYAMAARTRLAEAVDVSLAGVDALAGPTVGFTAPAEDPPFGVGEDSGEGRFTGPYNLTGHPAISLPVATAGLPAGLQLAGALGGDADLLRVAAAAQALLGSMPPGRPTH